MDLLGRDADVLQPEGNLGLDAREDDLILRILEGDRNGAREIAGLGAPRVAAGDLDAPRERAAVKVRDEAGECS